MRLPESAAPRRKMLSAAATISSGSAMRPSPASPRSAISPELGPTTRTPSAVSLRQIARRCFGRPHARIHRRRDQDRLVGCQQNRGRQIVGVTAGHFGEEVRGCRRNDNEIGVASKPDVPDVEFALRIEQIGKSALSGERADGKRRHKMPCGRREDAAQSRSALLQAPDQIERLIGGDAAADDEENAWSVFARRRGLVFWRRGRREPVGGAMVGFCRGFAQDHPDLVLHGSAVARRTQPQQLLQRVVELANSQAGQEVFPLFSHSLAGQCLHCNQCNQIDAISAAGRTTARAPR